MKIAIKGNEGNLEGKIPEYYIQTFSLLFFPDDNNFGKSAESGNHINIFADKNEKIDNFVEIALDICYNKQTAAKSAKIHTDNLLGEIGKLFYSAAGEITGIYPPWGMHTGIRPAKTAGEIYRKNGFDEKKTVEILCGEYLMHEKKAALALAAHKNGEAAKGEIGAKDFSLYISIPFCPTRCRYCSFVSFATPRLLKMIPQYAKKLIEEIKIVGEITRNMRLKTIYIGGGTPSALDAEHLERILGAIKDNFCFSDLAEYTAECGRPDTITAQKLELFKNFGINRVSVNPQTLNDETLKKIGRNHNAEDFFAAFEAAKKAGIDNINTDCIMGFADESGEIMEKTVKTLACLKPENITVHSLCLKKSSDFKSDRIHIHDAPELNETLEKIYGILTSAEYFPYYMYRQKYAAGNLENTGFCKKGRECLYNIYMMDELMPIFSAGAGAMTKIVKDGKIERIANYKYPYEYVKNDFQINSEKNRYKIEMLK